MTKCKSTENLTDLPPLGMDSQALIDGFKQYYTYTLGRDKSCSSPHYPYKALAFTLRDRLMERWKNTRYAYEDSNCKRTYYLSLEFLMGRALNNSMLNLGLTDTVQQSFHQMGLELEKILEKFKNK